MNDIILASQSPRRKMLLEWAEIPFEVIVKNTDESFPAELSMPEIAIHIARNKALAVKEHVQTAYHAQYANKTILAADTIVVLGNQVIGKPKGPGRCHPYFTITFREAAQSNYRCCAFARQRGNCFCGYHRSNFSYIN